ncbi:MAG: hypothetical protein P8Y71_12650 [Pseudolabrys sp.]
MAADFAVSAPDDLDYAYRPSLLGPPAEFRLRGDALYWSTGRRSGRVRLRDVRMVRLSYKPASMQPHRFATELWAEGAPKLEIVSSSWKSMVEQERQDASYVAFVTELHRRIARAGAPARFVQGKHALLYWPGLALFVVVGLLLAALVPRALQADTIGGAVFILAFLALFLWQGGNFFRRNRPGIYRPNALPPELLPRA